ncbi:hypothetical protein AGMMS49949_02850 [Alphaproteobacteria bacterium]|nr:hypothetical protein AGMMS49949_02850 [Alphaproteobacteria bacterium]GHS95558.1 hypothetical protein AGMMS50296_0090 [Alphaproteobacteria bacterium]
MKVVLLERVENLGFMGNVVTVKRGYARNFLLPRKKALRATKENLDFFEAQKIHLETENIKKKKDAEQISHKVEKICLNLIRQAGESGHLFGSVRSTDIANALIQEGVIVHKTQVSIPEPIKGLGVHVVKLTLHPEVSVSIKINVAQTEEEAAAQWEAFLNPVKEEDKEKTEKKGAKSSKKGKAEAEAAATAEGDDLPDAPSASTDKKKDRKHPEATRTRTK